jgi:hypothetical protein
VRWPSGKIFDHNIIFADFTLLSSFAELALISGSKIIVVKIPSRRLRW